MPQHERHCRSQCCIDTDGDPAEQDHLCAACCVCLCFSCSLPCRLKEKGRTFRESFLAKLCLLLRGTVAAPPERFGETLADEHIRGGEPQDVRRCTEAGSADAAARMR